MSHRKQQVESLLKRTISGMLARGLSDPRVRGLVSVTRVEVSPDYHDAYVYVSVMPERFQQRSIAGLRHAAGHIRARVREAVSLRKVPQIEFRLDDSLKKQDRLLREIEAGRARDRDRGETDAHDS